MISREEFEKLGHELSHKGQFILMVRDRQTKNVAVAFDGSGDDLLNMLAGLAEQNENVANLMLHAATHTLQTIYQAKIQHADAKSKGKIN
jgi:hypothetical protein